MNERPDRERLTEGCLRAFVKAGTLDLSLDQLAIAVGISKRMLVHYFGGRENIEERAMVRLEETLRAQFSPESFPPGASAKKVVKALWARTTAAESRGALLLVMDVAKRAWSGSTRAKAFYEEQQRLWEALLLKYIPDRRTVEEFLQLFQGAVFAYLISGDADAGKRALLRFVSRMK